MNRFAAMSVVSLITAGAFFSACSDDANPEPGGPEGGTGAKPSGTGGKGTGGGSGDDGGGTGAKPSTGGKGTGGSGTGNASGMPEGGPDSGSGGTSPGDSGTGGTKPVGDAEACTEDTNTTCIECPKNDKEFLNACTDSKCTPFAATLEKIVNGMRPALP